MKKKGRKGRREGGIDPLEENYYLLSGEVGGNNLAASIT